MGSDQSVPAAFQLTVVDGQGLLSFGAKSLPTAASSQAGVPWAALESLELEFPAAASPRATDFARTSDGTTGLHGRRLAIRGATILTSVTQLAEALLACPLADAGVKEARVWMAGDGLRLVGRFKVGNREAPFTIRVGLDPRADGRRRLRISLGDVRLFAQLPLPAPLVGAAIARAIGRAAAATGPAIRTQGPAIDVDPLELALISTLVAHGWRLPNIRRGWLKSVERTDGELRLRFGSEGHPTERMATLEPSSGEADPVAPLSCLEGERLPETLARAEEFLQAGDLVAAEAGYRQAVADGPDDRAAAARLLALRSATGGSDTVQLSGAMILRWPDFLPGLLYGAIAALEAGDTTRAAALFGKVAALADDRGEFEDAALARAAQTSAIARGRGDSTAPTAPTAPAAPAAPTESSDLAARTEQAVERGDLVEADLLFEHRLALAHDGEESASLIAERARVQLLGPEGATRALATLRGIEVVHTPEEGLVLRADLAERVGDLTDARKALEELVTRAVAAGDMSRARELAAHQAELSAHQPEPPSPMPVDPQGIPRRAPVGESGAVTAKTEAVYAEKSDPDKRAEALGELLQGFEHLDAQRQHAAYASFGRVAESTGDLEHAEEAYWRATRVDGPPTRLANDLLAHARVLLSRGNVAAAVTELEQALTLAPGHAGVLTLLADQAFAARDWERARGLYAQLDRAADAADQIPRETLVQRRAFLARQAGDAGEAESCYRELAILNPRHIEARRALAQIALERGDLTTAADRLGEVLRLLPMDALDALLDVRQRLGEIHVGLGDWGAARYYVELVLAQDPGRLPMVERLADIYEHLGLHAAAADAFDRLSRLYTDAGKRAMALFHEGAILEEHLGDEARGFDAYLKSSDLDPGFAPTALKLIAGFWRRGALDDAADIGDDLRRVGPLPEIPTELRLRLALATALAREDIRHGADAAGLFATPWNADQAAVALAETATHLSTRPLQTLEPAVVLIDTWRQATTKNGGSDSTTDWLWAALRARITKDPADTGAARALGWLADRKGDATTARGLFAMVAFLDDNDGAATRLAEWGPAPPAPAAALALCGPADHPDVSQAAAPLRRALQSLARGLAGFGPLGPAGRRTSTGDLALRAELRDSLYALAQTFGTPALGLVTGEPRSRTPGDDVEVAATIKVVPTRPATVEIPLVLVNIPDDEMTFLVARAFDRLRCGLALIDTTTGGNADDVANLLWGARAALTGATAPDAPLARTVAHELSDPERAAALRGASPQTDLIADFDRAPDALAAWDTFRAGADRASDRFALLACRGLPAALRALYRTDSVVAPGADEVPERARRVGFLRTARVRALLRFVVSDDYARALTAVLPDADT